MLLLLLWMIASSGQQLDDRKAFTEVMRDTLWWLASGYIITSILQAFLRSERYRLLLKADGTAAVPGPVYMLLITLCRNMFVDMVPARIGEASYILMLNRAYDVRVSSCLSTLFISMVLDVLALALILLFLVIASLFAVSHSGISIGNVLAVASIITLIAGLLVYAAVPLSRGFLRVMEMTGIRLLQRFGIFIVEVGLSIKRVRIREMLSLTLSYSLGIRALKYGGLFLLFTAVTTNSFSELSALPFWQVLPAFVSAEAAASLPLPTFMSFGSYEGGGMLAFSLSGFAAADILLVMFAVHLISQAVDYTLGCLGLLGFFLATAGKNRSESGSRP